MPLSTAQAAREAGLAADRLYIEDFYGWSVQQTEALQRRDLEVLDWENVAEEIESLGNEQRNAWVSLCGRVIQHMLQIENCERDEDLEHWQAEIQLWRMQMADRLRDNPSLTGSYREIFDRAWNRGRGDAVESITDWAGLQRGSKAEREHKRSVNAMLPEACPYRLLEVTAFDTEERKPDVRRDVMPPAVASILNDRGGAGYQVRPWPGLDFKLEPVPRPLRGPKRSR